MGAAASLTNQEVAQALDHHITRLMTMVATDPHLLAEVVGQGRFTWRTAFIKAFKGFPISVDIADRTFHFFEIQHRRAFGGLSPKFVLDQLEVRTPATQAEIDRAWAIESGSTEAGKRHFYGPDGSPEELIRQVVAMSKGGES